MSNGRLQAKSTPWVSWNLLQESVGISNWVVWIQITGKKLSHAVSCKITIQEIRVICSKVKIQDWNRQLLWQWFIRAFNHLLVVFIHLLMIRSCFDWSFCQVTLVSWLTDGYQEAKSVGRESEVLFAPVNIKFRFYKI